MSKKKKIGFIILAVVLLAAAGYCAIHFWYPFGVGVKAGQLNYVVYKGYVFKTYEGKLIQSGLQFRESGVGSNEFEFSVADKDIAEKLMRAGGRYVELHYKEYFGALLWRGYSKFVVDSIVNIKDLEYHNPLNQEPQPVPADVGL